MVVDLVAAELERVHERIGGRFARAEPRARVREQPGLSERTGARRGTQRQHHRQPIEAPNW